ncbi:FtsK/SpoIIIE domain-containing protein [Helicobacter pylori]|uniref:ATP-binding protein n=1 Tax=Helicobacter pylori TaxID=210 RepID=A0ABD4B7L1_HELPX|nr:FtsK/SpoIIIE domain-containing protein [Helicobacter pylori]KOS34640.1 ATP-binding protein [Helicobacter pylori]
MIDVNGLLKELDDALDKVVPKKEPESFLKPSTLKIEEYQKSIRQIQAQFTDAPQFNEEGAYPQFLSCGLLHVSGKNGANMEFLLPKVYPFPPKSLYIEHEKDGQFLREMLMHLLSSAPLVQLEVILIDALSLGGIFGLARKLLKKDDKDDKNNDFIYQQRILTESKEIEEALKHLYEYLKVNLQEKLAGFRDFAHYNENEKDPLPLKALFLSGVDALSQNALYYLEKIMRFGSKNGVLSFVNLESEKNKESAEDLKKHAEFFKDTTSFECLKYLNVEVINDQGIKSQHMKDFADKIKAYYKQKKEVKRELKDLQKDEKFWTESSQFKVSVPVGWDINHKEVCFEIGNAQNHTLICDHSGSGKSNFLHVLIQNLAFYYAPNEVQLFLLDYREGVEFNAYTDPNILEHARLVSVASSVGFGMSFLSWLCDEMKKRSELFKQFKVKDLSDYRKHEKMPRLIVVIDEFQVLFSDKSTKGKGSVERSLNTLLKKGRSYGVHLVLATQTMRGTDINPSFKAQIANRIALPMDAEDSSSVLGDDAACELVRPEGIFNNNGGHQKYHTKMSIPKAPDDFKSFLTKIHAEFNQRNLAPIDRKIYNGEKPLEMPNTLKANEMRLHLGKEADYEQKDLVVEFESNESHLLVVSQDLSARIALMKLLFQNIKSANKELVFCNKEKRLIRFFDVQKEYGITPVENILSVLDTAMNPNSVLVIDNLNEAKELHDKVGAEKLKSFLEKAIDNEQYCVIFAHDYRQIKNNYHLDKLKDLLNNHFKQCLAFRCNEENLNAIKNNLPPPSALNNLNALFVELSKDSRTEFRPFSL